MNKFIAMAFVVFAFVAMSCLAALQYAGSFGGAGSMNASFAFCFVALVAVFGVVVYLIAQWSGRG